MQPPVSPENFWSWSHLLTLALTTGFATAVFNQLLALLKDWFQQGREDRRDGKVTARELVGMLTRYSQQCSDMLEYNEYDRDNNQVPRNTRMPELPEYPDGIKWAAIPSKIAIGLSDLRNEVHEAKSRIKADFEVDGDPHSLAQVTDRQLALIGYRAYILSKKLRREFSFGAYQSTSPYPYSIVLTRHYKKHHQNWLQRVWNSRPISRIRSQVRRWKRRLMKQPTF